MLLMLCTSICKNKSYNVLFNISLMKIYINENINKKITIKVIGTQKFSSTESSIKIDIFSFLWIKCFVSMYDFTINQSQK